LQLQVQWHHLQPSKEQSCVMFANVKKIAWANYATSLIRSDLVKR
jgi:hypothetical protein